MKNKCLLLTKIQLMSLLGFNKAKNSTDRTQKRKLAGFVALWLFLGLILLFYIVMIAGLFCSQGLGYHLPALSIALSALVTLFFSLLHGCSSLFAMKDYDLIMSLPVSKRAVLASRLLCDYLANLAFTLAITIPCIIVFFIMNHFSAAVLFVTLAASLFAPVLPMMLALIINTIFASFTARFRYKNLLQSFLGIAAFVALMVANFSLSFSANSENAIDANAIFRVLVGNIYPPALLIEMTLDGEIWAIFLFVGASAAIAAIFILLLARFYEKIHNALAAKSANVAYSADKVRASSAFKTLAKREFKRLFSCPVYLLNGLSGTLLLLIAGVALIFADVQSLLTNLQINFSQAKPFLYAGIGIAIFCIGSGCPSASALSLEGSSRDQLFALPLSARKILLAKAFPTFSVNLGACLFAGAILCWKLQATVFDWVFILASLIVCCAFFSLFGIFLNLKFPKYDWKNETQVVKQSIPVMILVFGSMVVGFGIAFLSFLIDFWITLAFDAAFLLSMIALLIYFKSVRLYV